MRTILTVGPWRASARCRRDNPAHPGPRRLRDIRSSHSDLPDTLSYEQAGVNYDLIDPLKVAAQRAAAATASASRRPRLHRGRRVARRIGLRRRRRPVLPRQHRRMPGLEGAGRRRDGRAHRQELLRGIAQDTIAMAINDLITVGATPLVVQAYWAAGGSEWFADKVRAKALVDGWKAACDTCGVAWGGGETPALAGIVEGGRIDLAASCTGIVSPKSRLSRRRPPRRRRRHRAARLERHPRQRPQPGAQARRAPAQRLHDAGRAGRLLRRGPARADRALFAGHRGAGRGRRHGRTTAPTSPATAGASCCATRSRSPTASERAAGAAGAEVHPATRPARRSRGLQHPQHGRRLRALHAADQAAQACQIAEDPASAPASPARSRTGPSSC